MPNPGESPLPGPFLWSVKMKTSGMYLINIPLADSIMRLVIVGDVRRAYATPRIFLTFPGSMYWIYEEKNF